ncbi:MAG: hypothetical protein PHX30_05040 [Candidatus Pacebacteria bacterium]|jgi:hypothetical protein|nr:hypothetical protein [Candidatus Paceibacterota bacterium]
MENRNVSKETEYEIENDKHENGGRVKPVRIFMLLLFSIFILFIVYIAATFIFVKNSSNEGTNSDDYFKGCSILEENCTDISCVFYNSCNGVQKECKIYDCGNEYGIFIKNFDDKIEKKKEAKPDTDAIAAEVDNCKGTMQILDQGCVDNGFQAKVQLTTKGECNVGAFVLTLQEYGNVQNEFESLGGGVYVVTSDRCGRAMKIGPVTVDGMYLEF